MFNMAMWEENKVLEDFTFQDIFDWFLIWILGFYLKMEKKKTVLTLINFIFNHNKKNSFKRQEAGPFAPSSTVQWSWWLATELRLRHRRALDYPWPWLLRKDPRHFISGDTHHLPSPRYGQGSWLLSPWPSLTYLTPHSPTRQTLPWALRVRSEHHSEKTIFIRDQALR